MTTERKRYVIVPEWLIDHAEFTDEMRSAWLKLAGFMQQRWRSQRLTGEQACEILLSLKQLRLITGRTQIKVCLKFIRSLSELCSKFDRISIEVEGNFTRVRWPKFSEMQRLGARKSAEIEPEVSSKTDPPGLLVPRPFKNPENTQIRWPTQKERASARAVEGMGATETESELLKKCRAGSISFSNLPKSLQQQQRMELQGRVQGIYRTELQAYAVEIGFPWSDLNPIRDNDLIEKMAEAVIRMSLDLECLGRAQRGAVRYWKGMKSDDRRMQSQFIPATVFGDNFDKYHEHGLKPDLEELDPHRPMTAREAQAEIDKIRARRGEE